MRRPLFLSFGFLFQASLPGSHKDKGENCDRLYRIPPCKEGNPDPRRPKPWLRQDDKETFTPDLCV